MEICIHLDNGECFEFEQQDAEQIENLGKSLVPGKLFVQPQIIIQSETTTLGFACAHVEWIDFRDHGDIIWKKQPDTEQLTRISREIFRDRLSAIEKENAASADPAGKKTSLYEFIMSSGARLYIESRSTRNSPLEQRQNTQSLLHPGGLFLRGEEGGDYAILNPVKIARWNIYPPVEGLGDFAWHAKPIGQKE